MESNSRDLIDLVGIRTPDSLESERERLARRARLTRQARAGATHLAEIEALIKESIEED